MRLFIAEGIKTVNDILAFDASLISNLFATKTFIENNTLLKNTGVNVQEITEDELRKISLQASPNAVVAICNYFDEPNTAFDFENQFSLYLDDIRDPGNFGTIIRLADWFGISTVFCSKASCDLYNPKVIQASMGAFLRTRVIYLELNDVLTKYRVKHVYGAVLNGSNLYSQKLESGLIVIGNEANGISEPNLQVVNHPVTIPAADGSVGESLNAAMAASIIVSEFFRQSAD